MTTEADDAIRAIGEGLTAMAGSYLFNVVREHKVTCRVCALPISPTYDICPPCLAQSRSRLTLANRVGSLIYAEEFGSQAYRVVRGYKDHRPGSSNTEMMQALLALGLRRHSKCARVLGGGRSLKWTVVPSTKGRHALAGLVRGIAKRASDELVIEVGDPGADRELRIDRWKIPGMDHPPEHVLVIDDSWATGAHAQSLAAGLKAAGVEQVSIFTVARILSTKGWDQNASFIHERLETAAFDWTLCPWTGGACPPPAQ